MPPVIGELDATIIAPAIGAAMFAGVGVRLRCLSVPPPFRKRSVMHEDLEIHPSAKRPGCAINQATRAHFANSIQRLKDERRYRVCIDPDRDATRFRLRSGGRTAPMNSAGRPFGAQTTISAWGHPKVRKAVVAAVERQRAGAGGTRKDAEWLRQDGVAMARRRVSSKVSPSLRI
jgi:hypothetical protein